MDRSRYADAEGACGLYLQDGEATEAGFGCVRVVAKGEAPGPHADPVHGPCSQSHACLPCAQSNKPDRPLDRNLFAVEVGRSVRQ
jgi:hypothetical protein